MKNHQILYYPRNEDGTYQRVDNKFGYHLYYYVGSEWLTNVLISGIGDYTLIRRTRTNPCDIVLIYIRPNDIKVVHNFNYKCALYEK